jgi:hypothetical protein
MHSDSTPDHLATREDPLDAESFGLTEALRPPTSVCRREPLELFRGIDMSVISVQIPRFSASRNTECPELNSMRENVVETGSCRVTCREVILLRFSFLDVSTIEFGRQDDIARALLLVIEWRGLLLPSPLFIMANANDRRQLFFPFSDN